MKPSIIRAFFKMESASGIMLLFTSVVALILANSPISEIFERGLEVKYAFPYLGVPLQISLRSFVNDGLMTLFFLLIGLELKGEWAAGNLSFGKKLYLPGVAAIAGMLIPALVYVAVSFGHPVAMRGWAVPMATDIAFSLGVLSLFRKRVPSGLVFFVMLLAIVDDAGAVLVIALFYSGKVSLLALVMVVLITVGLVFVGKRGFKNSWVWCVGGVFLWVALWATGIHPVLAGVLLAATMPANGVGNPVTKWTLNLHPWVAFGIMPLFAFVNAGVSLGGGPANVTVVMPVILAISLGLLVGKPLGIMGFSALLVKLRIAKLPDRVNWGMFWGVSFLCGIGFTMSLFIGTLAFANQDVAYLVAVRQGVLLGSFISGIAGAVILYFSCCTQHESNTQ